MPACRKGNTYSRSILLNASDPAPLSLFYLPVCGACGSVYPVTLPAYAACGPLPPHVVSLLRPLSTHSFTCHSLLSCDLALPGWEESVLARSPLPGQFAYLRPYQTYLRPYLLPKLRSLLLLPRCLQLQTLSIILPAIPLLADCLISYPRLPDLWLDSKPDVHRYGPFLADYAQTLNFGERISSPGWCSLPEPVTKSKACLQIAGW
ncbi:hypothetical protein O6H91_03G101800 [Diphasiastrum complanatum]|uniref:Uncharacterized protein n=1 Tax=Diphasiastrum complanatum TaxID=34168 RepID=A0ACC2E9X6_DIPCM|nr:hypothetical protein O6H91_03G101800 [Diphasiastrum complanatum]